MPVKSGATVAAANAVDAKPNVTANVRVANKPNLRILYFLLPIVKHP
ncbi:hypothetical protein [Desulfitobacterium metallireducens]|nr:hypothetical protein [Desulfitobacterium metallireducens]